MTPLDRPDAGPNAAELAGVDRDLAAYVRGTAHTLPPDLVPHVLAAVAREAPPTPALTFGRAVAALAPRDAARAFGAVLALAGGRRRGGLGLRFRAVALVAATVVVLGSAAAGATIGGEQLVHGWLVTQAAPSPTATVLASPTPEPSRPPVTPTPADRSPHPSSRPGASEGPHESAEPSEPGESAEPSGESDDPSGDPGHHGSGGPGPASPGPSADD